MSLSQQDFKTIAEWEAAFRAKTGAKFEPTLEASNLLLDFIRANFGGVISVGNLDKAMDAVKSKIVFDVPPRDAVAEEKLRLERERVAFVRKLYKELEQKLLRSCGGQLSQDETARTANLKMMEAWLRKHTGVKSYTEITVEAMMKAVTGLYNSGKLIWDVVPDLNKLAAVKNQAGNQDKKETNALDQSGLGSTLRLVQNAANEESKLKAKQLDEQTQTEIKTTWGRNHARAADYRKELQALYDSLQAENKTGEPSHQKAQRIHDTILERQKQLQDGK